MVENEITLRNTKAEILDALNQALAKAEQLERGKLNPEKEERVRVEKKAVETAQKAVEQKNIFSQELNDKFSSLQVAVAVEENRLQELYGVGKELQKLALVIEAQNDSKTQFEATQSESKARFEEAQNESKAKFEAESAAKESAAKQRLDSIQEEYAAKNAELHSEHDAYLKKLNQERTRESEEYQYNLTRTREKENNAWEDEKASREAALKKAEETAYSLLAEAEGKKEYIESLEAKVEGFPSLIATERAAAVAEITEKLQKEFEFKSALSEKDAQSTISRLQDKVAYIEKELDAATNSNSVLQNKLDKAYSEMRDLATKTVETTGGVKIFGNAESKVQG